MSKISPIQAAAPAVAKPVETTSTAAAAPAKAAAIPATTKTVAKKTAAKKPAVKKTLIAKPAVAKPIAAKPVAKATATNSAIKAKPMAKSKPIPKSKPAAKAKPQKIKMERDSFTMPKDEYAQLALLKARLAALGQPAKKSELLRAGIKLLVAMSDNTLKMTMAKIPVIKTGRPKKK